MASANKQTTSTRDASRTRILNAAVELIARSPGRRTTVDAVAAAAECAKGLVLYHFKTKDALFAAASEYLWEARCKEWRAALATPDASAALAAAWKLLVREAQSGRAGASTSLGLLDSKLAVQTVNNGRSAFHRALSDGVVDLLERMGRAATVPPSEIAGLLSAVIDGLALQLGNGAATPDQLEPAWSAFWAAVLSLTRTA